MRVIDLLNKIANGEEVPRKFMVDGDTLYIGEDKFIEHGNGKRIEWFIYPSWLNEEVEIIEEDKKIRKITLLDEEIKLGSLSNWLKNYTINEEKIASCIECNAMKINEIIDYINKNEENK